jgi:hypothetical protein
MHWLRSVQLLEFSEYQQQNQYSAEAHNNHGDVLQLQYSLQQQHQKQTDYR